MEDLVQNQKQLNCVMHNQPIMFCAPQNGAPLCQICVQIQVGLIPYDEFNNKLDGLLNKGKNELDGLLQQLQQFLDSLLNHKQNIIFGIDKILQVIIEQIKIIQQLKEELLKLTQANIKQEQGITNITNIESELNQIKNCNQQVKVRIRQQIIQFQSRFKQIHLMLEHLKQHQKVFEEDIVPIPKKITIQEVEKNNSNKFQYELINEFAKQEDDRCSSFAFNQNSTLLIVGCYKQIIVYQFNNGTILKEQQRLRSHTDHVTCLYFMKQSNNVFVSGSDDEQIIIWVIDKNNQWIAKQILKAHQGQVFCLLMNNNREKLLISGSWDKTIKFWREKNDIWYIQQTININIQCEVYALSLNEEENKLISCGVDPTIIIFEIQQSNQQWVLAQTIKVIERGLRLSFTIGNQFVFQPKTLEYLEVYDYDNQNKQFSKITQVKIQQCNNCHLYFPGQFIKQLNILTVKHGNFLNILKINQDATYQLIQTIKYQHNYDLYGRMTDDGKYLVTWDHGSGEIQVRQMKFLKE